MGKKLVATATQDRGIREKNVHTFIRTNHESIYFEIMNIHFKHEL